MNQKTLAHPIYILTLCSDNSTWDGLVNDSPQGHIFSRTSYVRSLGNPYKRYIVTTPQGEILAGTVIMLDGERMAKTPFAFTPHQGILFSKSVSALSHQKRLTSEFRITAFLIDALLEVYPNFSMTLSPFFRDTRPFLWHNYGKDALPQFHVRQRYTGSLSLTDFELDKYLTGIRTVRRQEFKKTKAVVKKTSDLKLFIQLYKRTFSRQGIEIDDDVLMMVENICLAAIEGNYGYLSCAYVDDCAASMAFFVIDQNTAYYLFGANDPDLRDTGASSKLMIENIASFAEQGLKRFDFVGVNSPQRGDFKLSFNAELVSYQEVHLMPYA